VSFFVLLAYQPAPITVPSHIKARSVGVEPTITTSD
jgi:hypothetical protein